MTTVFSIVAKWSGILMLGLCVLAIAGCAAGGGQQAVSTEPPPFDIRVVHVGQFSKLSDSLPDGQYVVVTLKINNKSNETQWLAPKDFVIQNITDNEADQYEQENEVQLLSSFMKEYGDDKLNQLLEGVETSIHPRMDVERYIIYMLPEKASMDSYRIVYKPYDFKINLVGPDTEVSDRRENSNTYDQ